MRHIAFMALAFICCFAASSEAGAQNARSQNSQTQIPNQCNINGVSTHNMAACTTAGTLAVFTPAFTSVSSDPGTAAIPVDVYNQCRYIDNSSANSIFVPFNTQSEWQDFNLNTPSNVALVHCSRPDMTSLWTVTPAPSYGSCTNAPQVDTPNIYARYPSSPWISTATPQFTGCSGSIISIQTSVSWAGLDSDTSNPSWQPTATYGPNTNLAASAGSGPGTPGVPITVLPHTPVTLTWNVLSPAKSAVASSTDGTWNGSVSPASGFQVVIPNPTLPSTSTVYTYTVTDSNNLSTTASTIVRVVSGVSVSLTATPTTVNAGGTTNLVWTITDPSGGPDSCTATSTDGSWVSPIITASGTATVMPVPAPAATTTYTLTCSNSLQSGVTASAVVTVVTSNNNTCSATNCVASSNGMNCSVLPGESLTFTDYIAYGLNTSGAYGAGPGPAYTPELGVLNQPNNGFGVYGSPYLELGIQQANSPPFDYLYYGNSPHFVGNGGTANAYFDGWNNYNPPITVASLIKVQYFGTISQQPNVLPAANTFSLGTWSCGSLLALPNQTDCSLSPQNVSITTCVAPHITSLCGVDNGVGVPPVSAPCAFGSAFSGMSGSGPWNWTCSDGAGRTDTCSSAAYVPSAVVQADASCGSANGPNPTGTTPTTNLCVNGVASTITGSEPWVWTCTNGNGTYAVCTSFAPQGNATCDPSNGIPSPTPPSNHCSVGTAINYNQTTSAWNWTCFAGSSNTTASCSVPIETVNGACGTLSGVPAQSMPSGTALCSAGYASAVSGSGPWTWSCMGQNGGSDDNTCNASAAAVTYAACGADQGETFVVAPSDSLCFTGNSSVVTGNSTSWNWTCTGNGGSIASCSAVVGAGCAELTLAWEDPPGSCGPQASICFTPQCLADAMPILNNQTVTLQSTNGNTGSATYECVNGAWQLQSESCPNPGP